MTLSQPAPAATLRVTNDYPTVRAAYAAATNGDTIEVQTGLFLEPPGEFSPAKQVTFVSAGGRSILSVNTPPPNDDFVNRIALSNTVEIVREYNYAATVETNEPAPIFGTNAVRSLWWSWTAPETGVVVINTVGSEFLAYVDVYTGTNFPPTRYPTNQLNFILLNEVSLVVTQDLTYLIAVTAPNPNAYGQVVLNIVMPEPPVNDDFTNRMALEGRAVKLSGFTYRTRREIGEPIHTTYAAGRSVWYSWTAPTNDPAPGRPVHINTFGSDFDTVLAAYSGNALTNLLAVGNKDDIEFGETASSIDFVPSPGAVYQIAVDGSTKDGANSGRDMFGNLVLRVDYSLVNITVAAVNRISTNQIDGSLSFSADLRLFNHGREPTGPLRLRVYAASGCIRPAIHLATTEFQTNLSTNFLGSPDNLAANAQRSIRIYGTNPPPVYDIGCNGYRSWGAFVSVEQQLGPRWIPLDTEFLLYGLEQPPVPAPGRLRAARAQASAGGAVSLSLGVPIGSDTELPKVDGEQVELQHLVLHEPARLVETAARPIKVFAQLSDGTEVIVDPGGLQWTPAPGVTIVPDDTQTNIESMLRLGEFDETVTLTNELEFVFGGERFTEQLIFTVYARPYLRADINATNGLVQLQLTGEIGQSYVIESAAALGQTTEWIPVATNFLQSSDEWFLLEPPPEPTDGRFYRVRQLP